MKWKHWKWEILIKRKPRLKKKKQEKQKKGIKRNLGKNVNKVGKRAERRIE